MPIIIGYTHLYIQSVLINSIRWCTKSEIYVVQNNVSQFSRLSVFFSSVGLVGKVDSTENSWVAQLVQSKKPQNITQQKFITKNYILNVLCPCLNEMKLVVMFMNKRKTKYWTLNWIENGLLVYIIYMKSHHQILLDSNDAHNWTHIPSVSFRSTKMFVIDHQNNQNSKRRHPSIEIVEAFDSFCIGFEFVIDVNEQRQ